MLLQNTSTLLTHAISKFNPEVFTHPVWVRFGELRAVNPCNITNSLLKAVKIFQANDPTGACQMLLACAAFQNHFGQGQKARATIQNALALARENGFLEGIFWALWGACAVCFQQGENGQAASHLEELQKELTDHDEWVLSNYVWEVQQSLLRLTEEDIDKQLRISTTPRATDQFTITFDWLKHWGFSDLPPVSEVRVLSQQLFSHPDRETISARTLSLGQRWRRYWLMVKRAVRGEIKLQWVAKDTPLQMSYETQPQILFSPLSNSHQLDTSPSLSSQSLIHTHTWTKPADSPFFKEASTGASLLVYCLGPFRVYQDEQPVDDWPSSKGKAIFKYLVTHRERPVFKDILMDLFWPDATAESARNNLNVAVYGLRQALHKNQASYSHVLFINDCYLLNPEIQVWLDFEAFLSIINAARELERIGNLKTAINEYGKAETLYQGEFLAEDRYEDWLLPLRENLQTEYLSLLDRLSHHFFKEQDYQACIHLCKKMLTIDLHNEKAHQYLMRCFFERGQSYLALRQYYLCVEALKEGLNVAPTNGTKELYEYIRRQS